MIDLIKRMQDIEADTVGLNGAAMRGTNSAALATVCTETRLARLDATVGSRAPASEYDTEMARIDVAVSTRNATTPPTAVAIRTEMEGVGHDIALIKADVDGLNGDAMVGTNGANTTTPPTAVAIRTEMEGAGHDIALIKADVDGLNGDAMVGTNGANTTTPPTVGAIRTEMEGAGHDIALIKADVDGLGGEVMRGTDGANTTTPPTTGAIDTALSTGHGAGSWEGGAAAPTVGEIRTEMEKAGTKLTEVLVDTAGLNGDAMRGTNGANTTTPPTAVAVRTEIEGAGHDIALIKADVDGLGGEVMRGTDGANTDKTGYRLSAAGVDDVIDEVIEGTLTLRKIVRIVLSVLAGKTSGGGTDTAHLRDVADAKDRITATVDANGNRTAITLDGE